MFKRRFTGPGIAIGLSLIFGGGFQSHPHLAQKMNPTITPTSKDSGAPTLVPARKWGFDNLVVVPYAVTILDDTLIVLTDGFEPFLHLVDRRTGKVLRSVGRTGYGAGEMRTADVVTNSPRSRHRLWVFEGERNRMSLVDFVNGGVDTSFKVDLSDKLIHPIWVNDSSLAFDSWDLTPGAHIIYSRLKRKELYRRQLAPIRTSSQDSLKRRAYEAVTLATDACYEPARRRAVHVYNLAGRVDILGPSGALVATAEAPDAFEPSLATAAIPAKVPPRVTDKGRRIGYVGCAVTPDYIFALFSGKVVDSPAVFATVAAHIHVFDWSGRFIRAFDLSEAVRGIAYDKRTQELFGVRYTPTRSLVVYRMPVESPSAQRRQSALMIRR